MTQFLARAADFITGWRFAAFIISLCLSMFVFLVLILLLPETSGQFGESITEFKTWCFGYDPADGSFRAGYIPMMLADPLLLGAVVLFFWWVPLRDTLRQGWQRFASSATLGMLTAAALAGGLFLINPEKPVAQPLPFPGERIRTQIAPPALDLIDQNGERVRLEDLRGRVVLLTAIYTRCATACPLIMVQARRATHALPEELRAQVSIVAVTLDPEHDSPDKLKQAAELHRVEAPLWRLVTGAPHEVNRILDQLSISRITDPETAEIGHTNLFALIDRQGHIAYRLTLGGGQDHWLQEALESLAREPLPTPPALPAPPSQDS